MDTSKQPRIQVRRSSSPEESPNTSNKRMRARCLRSMTTVRLWNGAVSTDREHLEGLKKVVYTRQERVCDVLQRVVKRSLRRLVWEVHWMKSKSAWYPMWNRRQLGVEQRRIQHQKGWKGRLINARIIIT